MLFVTGADFRFKNIVLDWERRLQTFGFDYLIYDLGGLGFGEKGFEETDGNFRAHGYYNTLIGGDWKSTGLWKQRCIKDALQRTRQHIVYLDADAKLMQPIYPNFNSFDVGVVEREPNPEKDPLKESLRGEYNAGVLMFRNCPDVLSLIYAWAVEQQKTENDQKALCNLLRKSALRIEVFPSEYNSISQNGIIYHCTGDKKDGARVR